MSGEMKAKSVADLPSLPLGEATAQDIQLEIIRRWQFNTFDGPAVAAILNMETSGGMVSVYDDPKEVDNALGSGREKRAIVAIWWD